MILKNKIRSILSLTALTLAMTASQAFAEDPMSATPGAGGDDQDSLYLHYTVVGVNQIDVRVDEGETDSTELTDIRTAVSMEVAKLHVKSNQTSIIHACSENGSYLLPEGSGGSAIVSSEDPSTSVSSEDPLTSVSSEDPLASVYYTVKLAAGGIQNVNAGTTAPVVVGGVTTDTTAPADAELAKCSTSGEVSSNDPEIGNIDEPENSIDDDYPAGVGRKFEVFSAGNEKLLAGKYSDTIRFMIAPAI